MLTAIYARVSSDEQVEGYSISSQIDICRKYANEQGWAIYDEYIDPGWSGTNSDRPEYNRLLRDATCEKFKNILVYSYDRFSRDVEVIALKVMLKKKLGIHVVSVLEPIQDGPHGFLHEAILDVLSSYYSILLGKKIKEGLRKKAEAGYYPTNPPLGYKKEGGQVVIAPVGPDITLAFNEFSTGIYTLETFSKYAADVIGIRSDGGYKLKASDWSRIFNRRFYVGYIPWGDQEYLGNHPPLVDETTWWRVQDVLQANNHHRENSPKYRTYLLSRLLWSADANSSMIGTTCKGYPYYRSKKETPAGKKHYVRASIIESQVPAALSRVHIAPDDVPGLKTITTEMALALKVAPNMGVIYSQLDRESRRNFLRSCIKRFVVSSGCITDVNTIHPFFSS